MNENYIIFKKPAMRDAKFKKPAIDEHVKDRFNICRPGVDTGDVFKNENYRVIRWRGPGGIYFSYAQKGAALTAHFSAHKSGLRHIKAAISDGVEWAFHHYDWCKMIFASVKRDSVGRLALKCGFEYYRTTPDQTIYVRIR